MQITFHQARCGWWFATWLDDESCGMTQLFPTYTLAVDHAQRIKCTNLDGSPRASLSDKRQLSFSF